VSPSTADAMATPHRKTRLTWPARWRAREMHVLFVQAGRFRPWADGAAPLPLEVLPDWCREHSHIDLRLVLSGQLTHTLLVADPSLPLADDDDLRTYAQHQFVHYHGAAAQGWPLAPWAWGTRRGVVALHGLDIAALEAVAQHYDARVRSIESYWSVALRRACRDVRAEVLRDRLAFALVEGPLVTVVDCQGGDPQGLWQSRLDEATPRALGELIDTLRAEAGLAPTVVACGHGLGSGASLQRGVSTVGTLSGEWPASDGWIP
jgi:hypothetical protein